MNLNEVILMGRLTRDPEMRYTQNRTPVISFTLAINKSYGEGTDFVNCVAWRKTAEFVEKWFSKGSLIIVKGSIQSRKWEDKNGNNRISHEVLANHVQFGETKRERDAMHRANSGSQIPETEFEDFSELEDDEEPPF